MTRSERVEYWRRRLSSYVPGEIGVTEWCERNGVNVKSFYRWRHLLDAPGVSSSPGEWLAVTCDEPPAAQSSPQPAQSGVTLRLGRATIELTHGFDEAVLGCVLRVLEAVSC